MSFLGGMGSAAGGAGAGASAGAGAGMSTGQMIGQGFAAGGQGGGGGGSGWQQWGGGKYMQGIRGGAGGTAIGTRMQGKGIWDFIQDAQMAQQQRRAAAAAPAIGYGPSYGPGFTESPSQYWSSSIYGNPYQNYMGSGYGAYEAPPSPTWSRTIGNYYSVM